MEYHDKESIAKEKRAITLADMNRNERERYEILKDIAELVVKTDGLLKVIVDEYVRPPIEMVGGIIDRVGYNYLGELAGLEINDILRTLKCAVSMV